MALLQLALRGLTYHWRVNVAVALGVAAATAVLTGALLLGDSVRGSLRAMTLERLGRIDEMLVVDQFFREQLVTELAGDPGFAQHYDQAVGVMLFPQATVELREGDRVARSANVLVVGSPSAPDVAAGASFWSFEEDAGRRPRRNPGPDEIILNQTLADELRACVGDAVTVRLPKPQDVPADSPLGKKSDQIRSFPRLKVIEILPAAGLAQLSLTPSQLPPPNAFMALEQLQEGLRQPGRINSIFVAGKPPARGQDTEAPAALAAALRPTCDDLGLVVKQAQLDFTPPESNQIERIYDYVSISSQRMMLPPEVETAARRAFAKRGGQSVLTYLANLLEHVTTTGDFGQGPHIPYSTVTAIDLSKGFALQSMDGQDLTTPGRDEIILTDWAASDLGAAVGDWIRITYFEPETAHGVSVATHHLLKVKGITPLTPPAAPYLPSRELQFVERPTMANDPDLTPQVKGITDQKSIGDWEVPFTINYDLIRAKDDTYWEDYGTTPKAFVSLATGRSLWGSRFGQATSYRIPAGDGLTVQEVERQLLEQLARDGATLGFTFQPIKERQLQASAGNTPFDVLFLMLSFFVIAAALLLVALLFRLGVEQRAAQAGLLLALGWAGRRVRRLLVLEGVAVAAAGSVVGIAIGLGYAGLMLAALRSDRWWLGAVTTPFLHFHWTARSLAIGYGAGVFVSALTIYASVFQTRRVPARRLLAGQVSAASFWLARRSRWPIVVVAGLVIVALALAVAAVFLTGQQQAGAFVGAGATILTALLLGIWHILRAGGGRIMSISGRWALVKLAARSAARSPGRSTLTLALIATASFLIVAMSAFQLQPTATGTGGFALVAESSQPIYGDLNSRSVRDELLGSPSAIEGTSVYSLRVRPGDDASCGNLYRSRQPRILGVPRVLARHFDPTRSEAGGARFHFTASAAATESERLNPWEVLPDKPTPAGEPIPVVIDEETAMYSLRLYRGIGEEFTFTYDDHPITFRVVGLLSLSILHGNLLISEADFQRLFPTISGYRYFLIETPAADVDSVARLLEDRLSDQGFDTTSSDRILAGLMALQNTYLSTFQSLGALGLLLGTFGLAAVQLRSVLERRGEMGLLRATGFRRRRLSHLVLLENVMLLLTGLATGVVAAVLAVVPHMIAGGAVVPFQSLGIMLLIVLIVGIIAGAWAARATLRVPLLAALREER